MRSDLTCPISLLQVNILDNGDVCLEFLKSRSPTASVTEILKISPDGTQVIFMIHIKILCNAIKIISLIEKIGNATE